jgi:hypothetical protein
MKSLWKQQQEVEVGEEIISQACSLLLWGMSCRLNVVALKSTCDILEYY